MYGRLRAPADADASAVLEAVVARDIAELAAARRARGRGHGRAVLPASFDAFRADGLERAVLSVHGANRDATRLYESAGMRATWEAQRWEKELARA